MKMKRRAIAQDTLNILNAGYYHSEQGVRVNLDRDIKQCLSQTKYYDPETLINLEKEVLARPPQYDRTEFLAQNETTLIGAERLARSQKFQRIAVLNFASSKNPGGGFLNGAQAQEESLARSSALYLSLTQCRQYYDYHRAHRDLLYSNRIIYSPNCPVFRQDSGAFLEEPYSVDFITSPAPNAGQIKRQNPKQLEQIPEVLRDRASKVLSLAAHYGCDALVLGAWGCGVFCNDPAIVGQTFADLLLPNQPFWQRFQFVLFSVLSSNKQQHILAEFERRFNR
ncbi:TIGR02452 family protein [Roseofilum casamattae]|uniref:TIGR02452 family protein n=1 Tax=Roseofilum casamattae BLCC-M143 TaxID=3022442 RepID=A0ABT7BWT7_9CYAN|nr:TIGR02452 family protein [Roseofilum casamattae]MDJ1183662.1 TIGR02452 family protein [Roseofilum casamattae BLCC-M143]